MSVEILETIKQQIDQLNAEEQDQLERYIHERKRANGALTEPAPDVAERERKRRLRAAWLKEHSQTYAGLYVALDGDRLLVRNREELS